MSNSSSSEREEKSSQLSAAAPPCAPALRIGCILVAFLVPIKLSFTYIILIPLILIWAASSSWRYGVLMGTPSEKSVTVPLAFLLLSTTLSAVTGIDATHSISPLLSLLFFSLTALIFRDYGSSYFVPLALVTGQALASVHTVLSSALPGYVPSIFLGSVTESGQLALSLVVCLGLTWQKFSNGRATMPPATPRIAVACGGLAVILLSSLGFHADINIDASTLVMLWLGAGLLMAILITMARPRTIDARGLLTLSVLYLPLLTSALLLNLKRGPWLGITVGAGVFFFVFARKFLAIILTATVVVAATVPPIRERLAVSYEHFTISGGRSTIWRIGGELISQYPLGIGYHNSGIMRQFSLEIPPELKHFHNNLINIAAESGILSAAIFCWFIYAIIRVCLKRPHIALHVAVGCAIISWQVAGLVEYNFGDSEVMIIVWILLGLVLGSLRREGSQSPAASK